MEIRLINKYKPEPVDVAFYIGRGSGLGNPYTHLPSKYKHKRVATREEACDKYQELFDKAIAQGKIPPLIKEMEKALNQGKSIGLVCFCGEDKPCHGRTIRKYLLTKLEGEA